jgi:hypothetical protein
LCLSGFCVVHREADAPPLVIVRFGLGGVVWRAPPQNICHMRLSADSSQCILVDWRFAW